MQPEWTQSGVLELAERSSENSRDLRADSPVREMRSLPAQHTPKRRSPPQGRATFSG